jgi:phosphatidylserine/phosphatidylglycerophosphate/cardiolipin synthase-like enzyme
VKVNQKFFEPRIGHKYWPSSKFEPKADHNYWPPQELNKVHVEGIHGDAHWEAFISAIEDSKNTLFILSGWISSAVIDEQVLSLLEDAIKRGVKIYIGYGFSYPHKKHQKSPKANEALESLIDLQQRTIEDKGQLHFKEFKNHSKVIVVDNKYRIVGSNNWLSNRKYSNSEYSIKVFSEIETKEAQKYLAADF